MADFEIDKCPRCGAPVPASPAPLPPRLCADCLAAASKEVSGAAGSNPFDVAATATDADADLDKPLSPEEWALYRRLAARAMRTVGKTGTGGRIGGRSRSAAKRAASRETGKKGGRPRKHREGEP